MDCRTAQSLREFPRCACNSVATSSPSSSRAAQSYRQKRGRPRAIENQASSSEDSVQFTYTSGDGRKKATVEQVFTDPAQLMADHPWQLGWQMNETRLVWSDDLKGRLIKRIAANELGWEDEQLEQRLTELQTIMPDVVQKMSVIKPDLLMRFLQDTGAVAVRLVKLKEIFPKANVSAMGLRKPGLVLGDIKLSEIERDAAQLREMLPGVDIDRLVAEHPDTMLDIQGLAQALEKARSILPHLDIAQTLHNNPSFIFGFQSGSKLIPYDAPVPEEDD